MEMTDFLIKNKLEQIVENFKVSPKKSIKILFAEIRCRKFSV